MIRRSLFLILVLISATYGWGQQALYQNGIKRGLIKVKFSVSMTDALNKVSARSKTSGLATTGIQAFDVLAQQTSARNMYRLFPYDAAHESQLHKHGLDLWYVVEIDANQDPKTVASQFKQLNEVTIAEVEHEKVIAPFQVKPYTPGIGLNDALPFNDPYLKDQWHYHNTGQTGYPGADINLFKAWTTTAGSNEVIVSVHDQGVDVNHPDLKNNIWVNQAEFAGKPNVDDDNNGYIDDIHGFNFAGNTGAIDPQFHATHVAGTIAAVNNNGLGVSGVAGGSGHGDGAKIMSLEILGGGHIEQSYLYAAHNGAVISQNSWGYTDPDYADQSVLDAIDYFIAEAGNYKGSPMKGGIVIFASGNSNSQSNWYPGFYPNILSVSSLAPDWKKASYSNYGTWVEISAPGGEENYGTKDGILSTLPDGEYGYLQGTSMACPHVSGIAALALANRSKQLTNTELWNKLVTGVVNIDQYNPDFIGKMGTGAIDASLAISNDQGVAPAAITNLSSTGIAQEFITLSWTVPTDKDDVTPYNFELYYATSPITQSNLASATKVIIKNQKQAGEDYNYELDSLLGLTTYSIAITSTDRWGNVSLLSNVISAVTNNGPSIAVDDNSKSIDLTIDATTTNVATHDLTILNQSTGILRWDHFMRHKNTSLAFNASALHYPEIKNVKSPSKITLHSAVVNKQITVLKSAEVSASSFTPLLKSYTYEATNIIGDTDTTLTNSSATRFFVDEPEGFNLTQVNAYLKANPDKGPVILEVYKGTAINKKNLIYAQEYTTWTPADNWANITLDEQLYFESGSTFWLVVHVPSGNLYPLGIGYEIEASNSDNCFMSFNLGATWQPLADLLKDDNFAWSIEANSYNADLGTYLTLEPGSGDVAGNSETATVLTANGANLINGDYSANLILSSNDAQNEELRIPVNVTVSGHQPVMKFIDIADFGSVFNGTKKTIDLVIDNQGLGNLNDLVFSTAGNQFTIEGYPPTQIAAQEKITISVTFHPTTTGNINDVLTFTNGTQNYQIPLFGVGTATSKILLSPKTQTLSNLTIGDIVKANVTVKNTGAYPLKYFIPGYDTKGVSDNWPSHYHAYGYKYRTSNPGDPNIITYSFQDISSTGKNITDYFKQGGSNMYWTLDMGFEFPYYKDKMKQLYIAKGGFTTFDKSVNPINDPALGNSYSPKGYISPLGTVLDYAAQGDIFYQVLPDRVIVQYNNVWNGYNVGESITAQMVLFSNGDIRFYYDTVTYSSDTQKTLNILIEDIEQQDGIMISNYNNPITIKSNLALGFDYPGPDIITDVVNGSGILMPNASAVVNLTMSTASLVEGSINRYVNFISNDPANGQQSTLVKLLITKGGTPLPVVSLDTIAYGDVFQGAVLATSFAVKNQGTADVSITTMKFKTGSFSKTGVVPAIVKPGLYASYGITIPTNKIAALEDYLYIGYADGTYDTIYISGNVIAPPNINIDLSPINKTLAYGEISTQAFSIKNTGLANLEVVATGKQWLSFTVNDSIANTTKNNTYSVEKYNKGEVYQWVDIRKTGTQMPFAKDAFNKHDFWRNLDLPFPVQFYGKLYSTLKVGDNGVISFDEDPDDLELNEDVPTADHDGKFIMPYWSFSGFNTTNYPKENVGIFYKFYNDKIVITWSYMVNNFGGMGDPVSAQIIIYKNASIKFQYKKEEGGQDLTSRLTAIGIQESNTNGISISAHNILDYGDGLAYMLTPALKQVIEPGATLTGAINIDATNIYGGLYAEKLKFQTNVPGKENLEKPVNLTVTGDGILNTPDSVNFGKKMIAFEYGYPVSNTIELNFSNTGSAPVDINWAQMTDGTQNLSLLVMADNGFGPEWTDISYLYYDGSFNAPVYTIKPGDTFTVQAVFYPEASGSFKDELTLTTSLGDNHIIMTGTGFEPPVLKAVVQPVNVQLNTLTETTTRSIDFNNTAGKSDLAYEVSIEYGRPQAQSTATTLSANSTSNDSITYVAAAKKKTTAQTLSTFNRILKYTPKDAPDKFIGTGGGSFTVATKFTAGSTGFNLSHIVTWFRTESLQDLPLKVQVLAGGPSISDAVKIAEGSLAVKGSGDDKTGAWYELATDNPAGIYPNEDFYIVVTYPLGLDPPQGCVNDVPTLPNRYSYYNDGEWDDIQAIPGFENFGWLMYAAETSAQSTSWLSVKSTLAGNLPAGQTSSVELLFDGASSTRGDQIAKLVIKSNDPKNSIVKVPVKLHMNEAPNFVNVPDSVHIAENDTLSLVIGVTDPENNVVTVKAADAYKGVTYLFAETELSLTIVPSYGDAGEYSYTFIATDEYGAQKQITIPATIIHTNRAPLYSGKDKPFANVRKGVLVEQSITDLFTDPDGDAITFTAVSEDETIVTVFSSQKDFVIKPLTAGESKLIFTVKDSYGASVVSTLPIAVDIVLGLPTLPDSPLTSCTVAPNPTQSKVVINIPNADTGTINVYNLLGQALHTQKTTKGVDYYYENFESMPRGIYLIEIISESQKVVKRIIKN